MCEVSWGCNGSSVGVIGVAGSECRMEAAGVARTNGVTGVAGVFGVVGVIGMTGTAGATGGGEERRTTLMAILPIISLKRLSIAVYI